MADAKYGRLFTEADLTELLRELGVDPDLAMCAVAGLTKTTFPADEPLFLLRGQDMFAGSGVQGYYDGLRPDDREREAVRRAWQGMLWWQSANPDRVKVPD